MIEPDGFLESSDRRARDAKVEQFATLVDVHSALLVDMQKLSVASLASRVDATRHSEHRQSALHTLQQLR